MKRHADNTLEPNKQARRQPQTSCDSCRQKKLKCDRDQPCSSCRVRGLKCSLFNGALPSPPTNTPDTQSTDSVASILGRITALEQAVFHQKSSSRNDLVISSNHIEQRRPIVADIAKEDRQTSTFLDAAHHRSLAAKPAEQHLDVCVADTWHDSVAMASHRQRELIWLVPHADAIAMAQDFVNNACHVMPVIHVASVQAVINSVYAALKAGMMHRVDPSQVALIFSICSTCASFWNATVPCQHSFATEEAAMDASRVWGFLAHDSLEHAHKAGLRTLERAQAYAILAHMAFNTYGSSVRFYDLHSRCITACRDLGIHLVDGHATSRTDDAATREVKRRLWWHVTTTDWMLSLTGGPLDGTYTIHPRHIKVAKPRNLNDTDLGIDSDALAHPPDAATQTSCFLQAIQLGEVCRAVVDAKDPDDDIVDKEHNDRVLTLDNMFKDALNAFPPPLALDASIPNGAPVFLCLQRASVRMGFHSRRARLHHPFLLHKDVNGKFDDRFQVSRQICVQSARMVLDIAIALMDHSLLRKQEQPLASQQPLCGPSILHHPGHEECPGFPVHRLGVLVNHMFWACSVLAFESNLRRCESSSNQNGGNLISNDDDEHLHERLVRACQLFSVLGRQCATTADIVNGMRRVFTEYRIRGREAIVVAEAERPSIEAPLPSLHGIVQAVDGTSWPSTCGIPNPITDKEFVGEPDVFGNIDFTSELDMGSLEGLFLSNNVHHIWDQLMFGTNSYSGW